jgi:hypothetical protein
MSFRWVVLMADGAVYDESDRRWVDLDRSKLSAIDYYIPGSLRPFLHVDVPVGKRLVRRERVWPQSGERILIVGLENEDRSEVEVWLAKVDGQLMQAHLDAYPDYPPELLPFEMEVRK